MFKLTNVADTSTASTFPISALRLDSLFRPVSSIYKAQTLSVSPCGLRPMQARSSAHCDCFRTPATRADLTLRASMESSFSLVGRIAANTLKMLLYNGSNEVCTWSDVSNIKTNLTIFTQDRQSLNKGLLNQPLCFCLPIDTPSR